jgi:hypothetical protein
MSAFEEADAIALHRLAELLAKGCDW